MSHRSLAALMLLAGLPALGRADVVMPPPPSCPAGQVPHTDHGGPRCLPAAPTNCPPGHRGVVGGTCVVAECATDAECPTGQGCLPTSVCFRPEVRTWSYGALPPRHTLAAPPHPIPPTTVWIASGLCLGGAACPPPSECRPASVCLPPALARPSAVDAGAIPTGQPGPGVAPRTGGGCAGCAVPEERVAPLGGGLAAILLGLLALRRRRG